MAKSMSRRLVGLSGSAITAIYLAGYLATRGADTSLTAGTAVAQTVMNVSGAPSAAAPLVLSTQATSSTSAASSGYTDGTYSGTGSSRFGNVYVSVTVQGGRIANVAITRVDTSFPASRIASLPGQVLARQSAQVDKVTGATYSSQAFKQAVQQALSQAGTAPA